MGDNGDLREMVLKGESKMNKDHRQGGQNGFYTIRVTK